MRLVTLLLAALCLAGPALAADEPASATKVFYDHLVGTWSVRYEIYDAQGKARSLPGQVSYAWTLGGGALQEVWSDVDGEKVKPYATTIDYADSKHGRWTAVYIYPQSGLPTVMTGGAVGNHIELEGTDPEGALQRWWLGDLKPRSFTARYEISRDGGKTWRLLGINYMQRTPTTK